MTAISVSHPASRLFAHPPPHFLLLVDRDGWGAGEHVLRPVLLPLSSNQRRLFAGCRPRFARNEYSRSPLPGSTLTRVGSFMNEFYTRSPPPTDEERSTFQALFEVLRKEPHIVIGLAASANAEVVIGHPERIAKKPTQGKKPSSQYTLAGPDHATANGGVATPEAETEMDDAATPSKQITPPGLARPAAEGLQLIPDAATIPSMDLVSTFGEKLRIAVDPEFACYTLTGMPNRVHHLSPRGDRPQTADSAATRTEHGPNEPAHVHVSAVHLSCQRQRSQCRRSRNCHDLRPEDLLPPHPPSRLARPHARTASAT